MTYFPLASTTPEISPGRSFSAAADQAGIELAGLDIAQIAAVDGAALDGIGAGKLEEGFSGEKLLPDRGRFVLVIHDDFAEEQTARSDGGAPCGIILAGSGLLCGIDANPMFRDGKCAAGLVQHVTTHAARRAIHRAQTGMPGYGQAMASQAGFFGAGDQHGARRILMRIVTIGAGDVAAALTPALAVFQGSDLIGNQRVVRHGIFDHAGAGMALRARAHAVGNGQFARIENVEVLGVGAERGQMGLAGTMAVLAGYAGFDARTVSARGAVAGETSVFQIRR